MIILVVRFSIFTQVVLSGILAMVSDQELPIRTSAVILLRLLHMRKLLIARSVWGGFHIILRGLSDPLLQSFSKHVICVAAYPVTTYTRVHFNTTVVSVGVPPRMNSVLLMVDKSKISSTSVMSSTYIFWREWTPGLHLKTTNCKF